LGRNHERLRKNTSNFRVGKDLFLSLTENPVTIKEKIRFSPQTEENLHYKNKTKPTPKKVK